MFPIASTLHSRCCNIKAILHEIDCYLMEQSRREMARVKYRVHYAVDYDKYDTILNYRSILLSWANGTRDYDANFQTIISRIKHLLK